MIRIEMEKGGVIDIELIPQVAPLSCANFVNLVGKGYYSGTIFHRVIDGFMIQGGAGKPTDCIKGEFEANGVHNILSHKRGVISMARTPAPDSASSQFFICNADCPFLDGQYAAFGYVVSGMDVVDSIARVAKDAADNPLEPQVIKAIYLI